MVFHFGGAWMSCWMYKSVWRCKMGGSIVRWIGSLSFLLLPLPRCVLLNNSTDTGIRPHRFARFFAQSEQILLKLSEGA